MGIRADAVPGPEDVEAAVVERRDTMEHREPDGASDGIIPDKGEEGEERADGFDGEIEDHDRRDEGLDPLPGRHVQGFLHKVVFPLVEPAAEERHEPRAERGDPEPADLDEHGDHRLPEAGVGRPGVDGDQSRHADR